MRDEIKEEERLKRERWELQRKYEMEVQNNNDKIRRAQEGASQKFNELTAKEQRNRDPQFELSLENTMRKSVHSSKGTGGGAMLNQMMDRITESQIEHEDETESRHLDEREVLRGVPSDPEVEVFKTVQKQIKHTLQDEMTKLKKELDSHAIRVREQLLMLKVRLINGKIGGRRREFERNVLEGETLKLILQYDLDDIVLLIIILLLSIWLRQHCMSRILDIFLLILIKP